jgi:hypothetical protein
MQLWPRTISTKITEGKQVIVYSEEEASARFKQANFMDCRISAYPYWRPTITSDFAEITNAIAPNFILFDLDVCNFDNDEDRTLRVLKQTLRRVKVNLAGYRPTVIGSGNGYHVYITIDTPILEDIKEFRHINQISTKFVRFAEWYLSNGSSDHSHNSTVSLNNCMLRIPGSINSKNNAIVKIIKKLDSKDMAVNPNINLIIGSFCAYLADQEMKEDKYKKLTEQAGGLWSTKSFDRNNKEAINWIEKLLQTPLPDYRKTCICKSTHSIKAVHIIET